MNAIQEVVRRFRSHPPQMSPGNYVLHHCDYVSPVELSIEPYDKGGAIMYTAFGRTDTYYGSHDPLSFWEYVYVSLGVDRRRYFA
jgi:hypothetical protein